VKHIVLIDTSVLLNLLPVTGRNQQQAEVDAEFAQLAKAGAELLLPFAAVVETGNHIAKVPDGDRRRTYGQKLVKLVNQTIAGELPWQPIGLPELKDLSMWLADFPGYVQRNKSVHKKTEGGSMGDWLIVQDWEQIRRLNPRADVRIWSLDIDLQAYRQSGVIL